MADERSKKPFSSSSSSSSDRISGLSNDLLHKILSNFDLKEVVQTSILSRKWRYFWTTLSSLNLDSDKLSTTSFKFDDIVSRVLYHGYCQNSNLSTLKVTSNEYCREINTVSWIQTAVNRNVQILDIQLHQRRCKGIELPPSLFTCQSLTFLELALNMYGIGDIIYLPEEYSVNLPHLKELKLSCVHSLSTQFLEKIFSGCPVLEVLVITNFSFDESRSLVIASNVLKRLVILMGCDVRGAGFKRETIIVDAPNLNSFTCIDWNSNIYHLKNVSSLETMFLNNNLSAFYIREKYADKDVIWLQEICRVKSLTLARRILKVVSQSLDIFRKASISFPNLNYLNVTIDEIDEDYVQAVKWILENSPNIETLVIKIFSGLDPADGWRDMRSSDTLNSAEISERWGDSLSFRNLKCVELHNVKEFDNELGLLKGFLKSAKKLEEVTVYTSTFIHEDMLENIRKNLMNFPRVSARVKILFRKLEHCRVWPVFRN